MALNIEQFRLPIQIENISQLFSSLNTLLSLANNFRGLYCHFCLIPAWFRAEQTRIFGLRLPLRNYNESSAYNNAAFNTLHTGFDTLSDILGDLPVSEDPLNEAYFHGHPLALTFPLKAATGQAGLIGQGWIANENKY